MIQKDDVLKLADLARLETTDAEAEALARDLGQILEYVGQVNSIDFSDEQERIGSVYNVLREDVSPHESGIYTEDMLNVSPARQGDYVKVKKIL